MGENTKTEIESGFSTLERNLADMSELVNLLEKKLTPVIRPATPSAEKDTLKEIGAQTPMGETLQSMNRGFQRNASALSNLIDRLEI